MTGAISSADRETTPGEIRQFFHVILAAPSAGLDKANVPRATKNLSAVVAMLSTASDIRSVGFYCGQLLAALEVGTN